MPLMMVCACGHAGPLPETTGRFRCSKCDRTLDLTWFSAPRAYEQWQLWRIWMAGDIEAARVEFRASEAR